MPDTSFPPLPGRRAIQAMSDADRASLLTAFRAHWLIGVDPSNFLDVSGLGGAMDERGLTATEKDRFDYLEALCRSDTTPAIKQELLTQALPDDVIEPAKVTPDSDSPAPATVDVPPGHVAVEVPPAVVAALPAGTVVSVQQVTIVGRPNTPMTSNIPHEGVMHRVEHRVTATWDDIVSDVRAFAQKHGL